MGMQEEIILPTSSQPAIEGKLDDPLEVTYQSIWGFLQLDVHEIVRGAISWFHMLANLQELNDTTIFREIIMLLWSIWVSRNKFVFEGVEEAVEVIMGRGLSLLEEFLNRGSEKLSRPQQVAASVESWCAPEHGTLKVNIDGSFVQGKGGFGVVVCDFSGAVVMAKAGPLAQCSSAEFAECMAVWKAFVMLNSYPLMACMFETDCLALVQQCQRKEESLANNGLIIEEIKRFLASGICNVFKYVPRQANYTAHLLAQHGRSLSYDCFWMHDVPAFIRHSVYLDSLN